jgi:hypothetical protein
LKRIDRETIEFLTTHEICHPKADIDKLYGSRKEGERGLKHTEGAYRTIVFAWEFSWNMLINIMS